mgnify:CR=1 FL=1
MKLTLLRRKAVSYSQINEKLRDPKLEVALDNLSKRLFEDNKVHEFKFALYHQEYTSHNRTIVSNQDFMGRAIGYGLFNREGAGIPNDTLVTSITSMANVEFSGRFKKPKIRLYIRAKLVPNKFDYTDSEKKLFHAEEHRLPKEVEGYEIEYSNPRPTIIF